MNNDEKDDYLGTPEGVPDDGAVPASGDSFSVGETETDDLERLVQQTEEEPDTSPAIGRPTHLTLVRDSDEDPPNWPDF